MNNITGAAFTRFASLASSSSFELDIVSDENCGAVAASLSVGAYWLRSFVPPLVCGAGGAVACKAGGSPVLLLDLLDVCFSISDRTLAASVPLMVASVMLAFCRTRYGTEVTS